MAEVLEIDRRAAVEVEIPSANFPALSGLYQAWVETGDEAEIVGSHLLQYFRRIAQLFADHREQASAQQQPDTEHRDAEIAQLNQALSEMETSLAAERQFNTYVNAQNAELRKSAADLEAELATERGKLAEARAALSAYAQRVADVTGTNEALMSITKESR